MEKDSNPLLSDEFLDEIVQQINMLNKAYADEQDDADDEQNKLE